MCHMLLKDLFGYSQASQTSLSASDLSPSGCPAPSRLQRQGLLPENAAGRRLVGDSIQWMTLGGYRVKHRVTPKKCSSFIW
jgi:hypothetical protein